MWSPSARDFHIYRLNQATHSWVDTGVALDTRAGTRADTLWDGSHLYVASHGYTTTPSAGFPARLFRLSYNSATDSYTHDLGFPVTINDYKTETLVIDKDSKGVLWATWVQGTTVYVSKTVGGDSAWATPFALPAARAGGLTADDISSLIAFGGDKIGVMWSNQQTSEMLFAVHQDGDAPTNWHATETALGGANNADDSINLKTDQFGFVFAVTQTQRTDPTAPSNYLSVRVPGGLWTHWVVARKADGVGQPIVLLDEHNRSIHVFLASTGTFGAIYHKVTPMILPSFAAGPGTPFIRSGLPGGMTAPTSTKQNLGINTGIAVQSGHVTAEEYWHNSLAIEAPGLDAEFSGGPITGGVPFVARLRDRSIGVPTSWTWFFGDGGTSRARNPEYTYRTPGTYAVTLVVTDAHGRISTIRKPAYVVARPLTADFTATPPGGERPISIAFRDTSIGSPTSWAWKFGDNTTSTQRNPSHLYTRAGNFNVSLTVKDALGKISTKSRMISVVSAFPFTPSADTMIRSSSPDKNYGTSTVLRVKHGGAAATAEHYRTYLRFGVAGVTRPVVGARLRLFVEDASTGGGALYQGPAAWSEGDLAWTGAPGPLGDPLATLGGVVTGSWIDVPIPASVFSGGNGVYAFVLQGTSPSHGMSAYSSREGSNPPQLVLETN